MKYNIIKVLPDYSKSTYFTTKTILPAIVSIFEFNSPEDEFEIPSPNVLNL